jgi:hypothetical protein
MTADLSVFFNTDEFAETITYAGVSIKAIVDYGRVQDLGNAVNNANVNIAAIWVKKSDVASPTYRDTVVISGVTWTVLNVESGDGLTWKVNIRRDERPVI